MSKIYSLKCLLEGRGEGRKMWMGVEPYPSTCLDGLVGDVREGREATCGCCYWAVGSLGWWGYNYMTFD